MRSTSAAQGFTGSDPGRGHGTARQAMLRRRPTCHNKDPQLKYTTMYWGDLGRKSRKKKRTLHKELIYNVLASQFTLKAFWLTVNVTEGSSMPMRVALELLCLPGPGHRVNTADTQLLRLGKPRYAPASISQE